MSLVPMDVVGLVLHFRTPDSTTECLRSLAAENMRTVVLVDNSEDRGASLRSMSNGLKCLREGGLQVEVLTPSRNLGFAKGVNTGLVYARAKGAKLVLLINSDAQLESGTLQTLLGGLADADIAVPRTRVDQCMPLVSLFGFYQAATGLHLRKAWPGTLSFASGCCLLLRLEAVQTRPFNEKFFFYGEDVAFAWSLHSQGRRVVECPDAAIVHRRSGSSKNGSFFYEYHINHGHWLLAGELASNRFFNLLYFGCRCVTLPLRALVRSIRFHSFAPLHGWLVATVDTARGRCRSFTPSA